ncbi:ABC transporter ATP-binding protein [Motiliproteus sp. MSK22-1]|uniref:ABC transporter ATP-binding protein n=1 Tax=Motiliproteus sp. MSK22-1 TaxID=1897630 RepID=UPI0009789D39|nr:ABC transporter ATP-binding protein [Motiliproteus sp. MSK22-1]OMH28453.1 ABC transporter [Motiliproteus sp. MSK22-1]
MPQSSQLPRLELRQLVKSFPGCLANDRVDLKVMPGEIHALLGENGAGKSTLVKMIFGLLKPDSGSILWGDEEVYVNSPAQARSLGIGMVFQHFSLFEALTVKENIALGMSDPPPMAELEKQILKVEERYGLPLDPNRAVHSLSVGEKQRIEIVRCLLQNPRLLIMDEPTSVLTPQEAETLFVTLRQLAAEGCSILYISHKLDEVRQLCQGATILRLGKNVGACDPREETASSMAALMIGEELAAASASSAPQRGDLKFAIQGLSLKSDTTFGIDLKNISLDLHGGEILGIAGVAGNGQAELLSVLSGETRVAKDSVFLCGQPVGDRMPHQRRRQGLCFVPEERLGHGSVPDMSLVDNALLSGYVRQPFLNNGFVRLGKVQDFAELVIERFDVRCTGNQAAAGSLSGGNLQKFIVGREVEQAPEVLIIAQPTWGVDAGAAAIIHKAVQQLAAEGAAVLVISQDLDELLTLSHRISAICAGTLSTIYPINQVSAEDVGLLMTGVALDSAPPESKSPDVLEVAQ